MASLRCQDSLDAVRKKTLRERNPRMCAKLLQSCLTLGDLWTVAHQAPLSMGFSRQEYWMGFPVLCRGSSWPRDRTWVFCGSCTASGFFTSEPPGKPKNPISQFSSVAQSCWTLCDPMNRNTPGLPVHHQYRYLKMKDQNKTDLLIKKFRLGETMLNQVYAIFWII